MVSQQLILILLFVTVLGFLLWGRFRHDLVAAVGLFAAVTLGLVPEAKAFSGFSNPAVLIVALALIASRAFENSGVLGLIAGYLVREGRPVAVHIAVIGGFGAVISAVINNVAALALLMPLDVQAARKAGRSAGATLMPLSFATILGGIITLIGTPPNIIASTYRAQALGAPYQMFDFTPVGIVVALAGLVFIAAIGWRLIPQRAGASPLEVEAEEFMAELTVGKDSPAIGKLVAELDTDAENADVVILHLVRDRKRIAKQARYTAIAAGDVIAVEGATDGIAAFIKALDLQDRPKDSDAQKPAKADGERNSNKTEPAKDSSGPAMVEAVVLADARLAGRSAESLRLRTRFGVTLLGISHRGRTFREQVRARTIEPGDVLLLTGRHANLGYALNWLGAMPINEVSIAPAKAWRVVLALGLFAAAIAAAGFGVLSFAVALGIAVAGYAASGLVPAREFYDQIDWPVIVMLACLLPLGEAFSDAGGSTWVAALILELTHGYSPAVALVTLMIATMVLSSVLNNVATMVIAGPLSVVMAHKLGVSPDTFLMGAAIATSCAFVTPVGHKNNLLIMGPGGYAFGDYWRLGLSLQAIVLVVGVPTLLLIWPL